MPKLTLAKCFILLMFGILLKFTITFTKILVLFVVVKTNKLILMNMAAHKRKRSTKKNSKVKQDSGSNENKNTQKNIVVQTNEAVQLKHEVLSVVIDVLRAPSALNAFFHSIVKPEILNSVKTNELLFKSFFAAVNEAVKKPKFNKNMVNHFKKPVTFTDFILCEDQHFQEMLHVSRKTVKVIINNLRGIPRNLDEDVLESDNGPELNEPLDKILYLVLWYLRGNVNKMEEAVKIFDLGTIENASALFHRGIQLLLKLKEDSGLIFPTAEEQKITSAAISRRCGLSGVAGVMGYRIVKSQSGQRLLLQGLCNEKFVFVDLHISYDTRPKIAFQLSPLRHKIRRMEVGMGMICEELSFPAKFRNNLIYPVVSTPDVIELHNIFHKATSYMIVESFKQLFNRFERLNYLDSCDPDIIMASCVIYNYATKYNDLTPL